MRQIGGNLSLLNAGAALLSALVLLPVVAVVWIAVMSGTGEWRHLLSNGLPHYAVNSVLMMVLVGLLAALTGTLTAWLVVMTRFPGRGLMEWALLLPLALPAYMAAWAMADFMDYAGPFQTALRGWFGWQDSRSYWFPHFRSRGGAVMVLSMALYPYVYLLARAAFRDQSGSILDAARSLGCSPSQVFWRVAVPLARPAIAAASAIVMMEVLADFGTVDYFAVQTLTTGMFSVWTQASNPAAAAQIACVALVIVLLLVLAEKKARRQRRFHGGAQQIRPAGRFDLSRAGGWLALLVCAVPVILGFLLPSAVLTVHALHAGLPGPGLLAALRHTLVLASLAAALTVGGGLVISYALRAPGGRNLLLGSAVTVGYAVPGAVLALGVLLPLAAFDHLLADLVERGTGRDIGLVLTGSVLALLLAFFVRFFALAGNTVEAALTRITPATDMAARTLGQTPGGVLRRVHIPIMKGSLLVAGLLVFVDATKELPATLMLRPFNFETLATTAYNAASLENIGGAALPALVVTLAGLLPVLILARMTHSGWRSM
jgi:iron(III) transport system permease protein